MKSSTPINKSSKINEFEQKKVDDFLVIMAVGTIGTTLIIFMSIIVIVKRRVNKMSHSTKTVKENMYQDRKGNELQNEKKDFQLSKSTFKTELKSSIANQCDEEKGSEYCMVENSLYISADKVVPDNARGHQNVLDINPAVYSEIRDSWANEVYRTTAFQYEYAQIRDSQ